MSLPGETQAHLAHPRLRGARRLHHLLRLRAHLFRDHRVLQNIMKIYWTFCHIYMPPAYARSCVCVCCVPTSADAVSIETPSLFLCLPLAIFTLIGGFLRFLLLCCLWHTRSSHSVLTQTQHTRTHNGYSQNTHTRAPPPPPPVAVLPSPTFLSPADVPPPVLSPSMNSLPR